jgi:hypothetical protein
MQWFDGILGLGQTAASTKGMTAIMDALVNTQSFLIVGRER